MAFTLRPDAEQSTWIARLIASTSQRTASKAIWVAVRDYPPMLARLADLEADAKRDSIQALRLDISRLAAAVRSAPPTVLSPGDNTAPTFAEVAADYLGTRDDLSKGVRANWATTLAYAGFQDVPVGLVTVDDVRATLEPLWTAKRSVADKLCARIKVVFEYAKARSLATGNPVDGVRTLLPKAKVAVRNHASIAHEALGAVLRAIFDGGASASAKAALHFAALTACRSGEARGATWEEMDTDAATWTIPADRMKSRKAHVVPLSDAAMEVVREARRSHKGRYLFPSALDGLLPSAALSDATKPHGTTPHGLRSCFKSWAVEGGYRREAVELCLSHSISLNAAEAAYVATDLLNERREIMQAWADHLI